MNVGFTGTRLGMTRPQSREVQTLLATAFVPNSKFHHGNCVGADEEALGLAETIGFYTVAHPAADLGRLQLSLDLSDESRLHRAALMRNKDIVKECDVLIATPKESKEPPIQRGQGTWSTIRWARHVGRPLYIVWPDGIVVGEEPI